MKIFVSYTRNDGIVNLDKLNSLNKFLSSKNSVFIHAIESLTRPVQQDEVISHLMHSDVMLLLYTEGCLESRWVNLEIELSNLFEIPIITVDAAKLIFKKDQ